MSFFKKLLNTKAHPSTPESAFTLQKLLYKRYQDQPPKSQPLSPLIKTLFITTERSFRVLYECNTESPSVREAMKDCVLLMTRYEAQHLPSDLAELEERDKEKGESHDKLYTEVFVTLAEMVFLIYKMIKSVHDNGPNKADPDINQPRLTYAMDLIRGHALSFGFEPDGENLYNISKGDEEYIFLYMPGIQVNTAVEKEMNRQVRDWMWRLQQVAGEVANVVGRESVRKGIQ